QFPLTLHALLCARNGSLCRCAGRPREATGWLRGRLGGAGVGGSLRGIGADEQSREGLKHMHKIALIGAGRIGRIHAGNVAAHPELQLAYVVDPVGTSAQDVATSYGAKVADLDCALGDASVAGVIVASSTDTHLDFSLRAAQAGKAIFCEKPIDLDLARAEANASKFDAAKARMFLAFNRRFDPNFRALKNKLDAGAVGKLETLHITSHDPSPPPPSYVAVSGGLFKDMAIHDFDMARWLLGEEPSEVFAAGACLVDPEIGKLGDIDTAKTILRTPSGKLCVI